eukprot:352820-Chlamydomonas_euryale.AAC.2
MARAVDLSMGPKQVLERGLACRPSEHGADPCDCPCLKDPHACGICKVRETSEATWEVTPATSQCRVTEAAMH